MEALLTAGALLGAVFVVVFVVLALAFGCYLRRPRIRCRQCGAVEKNSAFAHAPRCPLVLLRALR